MTPGWWTELAVRQRIADLRREAAHERLLRWGRHGSQTRPGPELLTQGGDRS